MVRAVVVPAVGAEPELTEIDLPQPGPGQVRVRLAAAGVCHSDLSLGNGTLRQPFPAVLGHEGAGTVTAVGEDVAELRPGDPVLLNWNPSCGACHFCGIGEPFLCARSGEGAAVPYAALRDGTPLYAGLGTAAFAEETVVSRRAVLPLPADLPPVTAALLGCAVMTAYGAVHHAARVRPGESVAVYGLGGVGLAVVQAARLAGADPVVAVDLAPEKEELARAQGATHFLVSAEGTPKEIRKLTGHGADHAFECVGSARTIRAAWSATRRGGRTTVLGIGRGDDQVAFSALELFHQARTLTASMFGDSVPRRDLPVLADLVRSGRLDLDALVTDRVGLDGVPAAFARMTAGRGGRTLVLFDRAASH
ncbi:Zn-dependent alcohol dehydrogenase [Streptomyces capparidis]